MRTGRWHRSLERCGSRGFLIHLRGCCTRNHPPPFFPHHSRVDEGTGVKTVVCVEEYGLALTAHYQRCDWFKLLLRSSCSLPLPPFFFPLVPPVVLAAAGKITCTASASELLLLDGWSCVLSNLGSRSRRWAGCWQPVGAEINRERRHLALTL